MIDNRKFQKLVINMKKIHQYLYNNKENNKNRNRNKRLQRNN
jgi:hypothetical protein